jgi:hypothetical protein
MRGELMVVAMRQSTPSPLRGGIKGGGRLAPMFIVAKRHPHLTSPVKGEVPRGGRGNYRTPSLDNIRHAGVPV